MINIIKKDEEFEIIHGEGYWTVAIYSECGYVGVGRVKETHSEAIDAAMKDLVSQIIDDA